MSGLRRRLLGHYGLIITVTVVVLEMVFLLTVRQYYYGTAEHLLRQRVTLAASFYGRFAEGQWLADRGRSLIDSVSASEEADVQVLDWSGRVVVSSRGFIPDQPIKTTDFRVAMGGDVGGWIGRDALTGERVLAVSSPLIGGQQTIGVLRYLVSVEEIDDVVTTISIYSLLIGALVIGLSLLLSLPLAKSIIDPVQELTHAADRLAEGQRDVRAQSSSDDELGHLAEAFNHMADEITAAEKMKNDFISSISHELRTPLTSIKGWSETIATGDLDDQRETRQGLQIITQETDRMIRLVEELLDFSRIQSGRVTLAKVPAPLNRLVEQAVGQMGIRAAAQQVDLVSDLDPDLGLVSVDIDRWQQVLINLLDNALKFTPEHGTITVQTRCCGDQVRIQVADNGAGISQEDLPSVTTKFYKGASRKAGSGLGLSIVDEIVRLHGGELLVESELGKCTTVTVTLPNGGSSVPGSSHVGNAW